MTKEQKLKLAREFFRQVILSVEDVMDDEIYAEIDPDYEFGDELPMEINHETIIEVIRLGFKAKYGSDLGMQETNLESCKS